MCAPLNPPDSRSSQSARSTTARQGRQPNWAQRKWKIAVSIVLGLFTVRARPWKIHLQPSKYHQLQLQNHFCCSEILTDPIKRATPLNDESRWGPQWGWQKARRYSGSFKKNQPQPKHSARLQRILVFHWRKWNLFYWKIKPNTALEGNAAEFASRACLQPVRVWVGGGGLLLPVRRVWRCDVERMEKEANWVREQRNRKCWGGEN